MKVTRLVTRFTGRPSTATSSAGPAVAPSSARCPFTVTRPARIRSSALRRLVIPAAAMIFCRRSLLTVRGYYRPGRGSGRLPDSKMGGMIDPLVEKFARLITEYSTEVQKGDHVLINVDVAAVELARALVREVLKAGAQPHLRLAYPELNRDMLELMSDDLLEAEPVFELAEIRQIDAWIRVGAPVNT